MKRVCSFTVNGLPKPKGSLVKMRNGSYLPAGTAKTRRESAEWVDAIREAASSAMLGHKLNPRTMRLWVAFTLPAPRMMPRHDWGWLPHTKQPDLDKLIRMLCDALTGIVWVDDSQVAAIMAYKSYAWDGQPGAEITIDEIEDDEARVISRAQERIRESLAEL